MTFPLLLPLLPLFLVSVTLPLLLFLLHERKRLYKSNQAHRDTALTALRDAREIQGPLYDEIRKLETESGKLRREVSFLESKNHTLESWVNARGGRVAYQTPHRIVEGVPMDVDYRGKTQ